MTGLRSMFLWMSTFSFFLLAASASGQGSNHSRTPLDDVEDSAIAARSGDPTAIRAFVDRIFNTTVFAHAPESLRDRISRAEIAYRTGHQLPIGEQQLVDTTNELAAETPGAPPHAKTSGAQLHLFRTFLRRSVRHFAPTTSTRDMSPAEMTFVALNLATQKLTNAEYQVGPDGWVKAIGERQRHMSDAAVTAQVEHRKPQLRVERHPDSNLREMYWALDRDLPLETSDIAVAMHDFLDRLGIAR